MPCKKGRQGRGIRHGGGGGQHCDLRMASETQYRAGSLAGRNRSQERLQRLRKHRRGEEEWRYHDRQSLDPEQPVPSLYLLPTYDNTKNRIVFEGSYAGAASFSAWDDSSGNNRRMLEVRNASYESGRDNALLCAMWSTAHITHSAFSTQAWQRLFPSPTAARERQRLRLRAGTWGSHIRPMNSIPGINGSTGRPSTRRY